MRKLIGIYKQNLEDIVIKSTEVLLLFVFAVVFISINAATDPGYAMVLASLIGGAFWVVSANRKNESSDYHLAGNCLMLLSVYIFLLVATHSPQ